MEIRYDLEKNFNLESMCKIIIYYLNIGFHSDGYYLDSDEDRLFYCMKFENKKILIDTYFIKFTDFSPEDALREYKNIESMMDNNDEC